MKKIVRKMKVTQGAGTPSVESIKHTKGITDMNNLTLAGSNQQQTMSSREIAELTGKKHFHVKRDIEVMLIDLSEDASRFGRIYFDSMNREQTEYLLDRDHTECLLTGYSAKARITVIRRWHELESKPLTQMEIVATQALAMVEHERKLTYLEQVQEEQAEKLEAIEQGSIPAGFQTVSDLVKTVSISRAVCDRVINAFNVESKKIPFTAPGGILTKATIAHEEQFHKAYEKLIDESAQTSPTFCAHLIVGRFKFIKEAA